MIDFDIKKAEFYEILANEGELNLIYGRIGQGKTYIATCMIFDYLREGQVVYANWHINFKGLNEIDDKWNLFLGSIGLKVWFIDVPADNFHYIDTSDPDIHRKIGQLTDCIIFLDEGHLVYDSYITTKMDIRDRANILHTRHFNRMIYVVSQRPTAIHVTLRDNVNRYYKCEKGFHLFRWVRFKLYEYQDTDANGRPMEDDEFCVSKSSYWSRKEIFDSYDTKYLRGNAPISQINYAREYFIPWRVRFKLLFSRKKKVEPLEKNSFLDKWKQKNEENKST